MRHLKICGGILVLLATSACATRETPPIADSACVSFRELSYSVPPLQVDGTRNVADDPGNKYDTEETTKEAQDHNVRYRAACRR